MGEGRGAGRGWIGRAAWAATVSVWAGMVVVAGCSGSGGGGSRVAAGAAGATGSAGGMVEPGTELYTREVVPILRANCYRCHGGMNRKGGFNLQTRAGMMAGGKSGKDVIPGDPEASLLVTLLRHAGPGGKLTVMPPEPRAKLTAAEIEVVSQWVREGARMPADVVKP